MSAPPQPFDPGYDYEADKDIVERLTKGRSANEYISEELAHEAAATIRSLRLLNKHMERRINDQARELNALRDPEEESL